MSLIHKIYDISPILKKIIFSIGLILFLSIGIVGIISIILNVKEYSIKSSSLKQEQVILGRYSNVISNDLYTGANESQALRNINGLNQEAQNVILSEKTGFKQIVQEVINYSNMNESQKINLLNQIGNVTSNVNTAIDNLSYSYSGFVLIFIGFIGMLILIIAALKYGLE